MNTNTDVIVTLPPSTVPTSSPLPLPPRLFVPLPAGGDSDHLSPGTRVTRGQELVAASTKTGTSAISPAAGTIVQTRLVQLLDGQNVTAVEIEVDQASEAAADEDSQPSSAPPANPPSDLSAFIELLRRGGVTASRHTSPDLLKQLHDAIREPVDHLVCNLLDVDGGSSLHSKVIRESGPLVISGIMALARTLGCGKVWIAAAPGLSNRASVLVRKANAGAKIKVVTIENDYPQSDPTLLIYALTGRRLRPGYLPTVVKTVVLDGVAAAAVGRGVDRGEAMLTVPIEIRDSTRARSHVGMAAVGTPLAFVLESMGLKHQYTLRGGAALRDVRVEPQAIVSGNGEISIDAGALSTPNNPDPCIRSGWCVENCPVRINPAALLEAAQDNDSAMAETYGLDACIECGICSYVCPSRLPLLKAIRDLRNKLIVPTITRSS